MHEPPTPPSTDQLKPGFHMIAEKKGSAIVAIIWKALSSNRSNRIDYMETTLQRFSERSDSKNTRMPCVRSPISRWLPPRGKRNHWLRTFYERCAKIRLLWFMQQIFPQNIETSTRKTIAEKQLRKCSTWVPIRQRRNLKTQRQCTRDF